MHCRNECFHNMYFCLLFFFLQNGLDFLTLRGNLKTQVSQMEKDEMK